MKKRFNKIAFMLFFALISCVAFSQSTTKQEAGNRRHKPSAQFRVAFYNVENLFDTIDDPRIDDNDFLPGAKIPWTSERYELKLNRIARVIEALSQPQVLAVMGLCEVENKTVVDDLVKSPVLIPYNYQVIHRDSPDERGIDNALLYDPRQFQPVCVESIAVTFSFQPHDRTRDILYVKGVNPKVNNDTLHLFVNHWPSRSGGQEVSEPKRIRAAEILKMVTDSLLALNPRSLILVMGDLNDEPSDKSLREGLEAQPVTENPDGATLYNLMYPPYKNGKGTLFYKDWDVFDQVILSGNFWNKKKGFTFSGDEGTIFDPDWLMFTNNKGVSRPNRTASREYYGGYSDHLPVFVDLFVVK